MKIRLSLLCFAMVLGTFNVADAQSIDSLNAGGAAQADVQQFSGTLFQRPGVPGRVWFESNFADDGLGFEGSYFTLGGKRRWKEDSLGGRWLVEGQLNFSQDEDDGEFFTNIGLERVFSIPAAGAAVTVGAWYDYNGERDSGFTNDFHQVSVNASIKTEKWDLYGNGYFPVGNTDFVQGDVDPGQSFFGNDIVILPGIDSALEGFDFALRTRPRQFAFANGSIDIGGYHYSSDLVDSFSGGKVRVGFQLLRGMTVSVEVNHDDRFDTTGILGVGLIFGANASGLGNEYSLLGRDLEQTTRNDHIVRFNQNVALAVDPDTGLTYNAFHVDNLAAPGGDGTFENPFATLAEAEAASSADDIIFVREGDGTSTGLDTGIALQTGQLLLGDGVAHTIPLLGGGSFLLDTDVDGARPVLMNNGSDIVTLADRTTVAGFTLDGQSAADNGVAGVGITGPTTIRDNAFVHLTENGVQITGHTGDLSIDNNTFSDIDIDAIQINNVTSQGDTLAFSNNTIDDVRGNGIRVDTFNAENDWLFSNNAISNVGPAVPTDGLGDGISLINGVNSLVGTGGNFLFDGNTIDSTTRNGITIEDVVDPEAVFSFLNTTITNPGTGGEGDALAFINSLGDLGFEGASFTGAANGAGFRYDVSGGVAESLLLTGLTAAGNEIGVVINASNGTDLTVIADDNVFDMNTSHGIQLNAVDAGTRIDLASFAGNTVTNNGGRGLEFNGDVDTFIGGVVVENLFSNNALGGLVAESFFGEIDLTVGGVNRPTAVAGVKPAFDENQFVDNGEVGIAVVFRGDATGRFEIEENIVTGTTDTAEVTPFEGDGIQVRFGNNNTLVNSEGVFPVDPVLGPSTINRNFVDGNAGDGIELFAEDETIVAGLDIIGNVSTNNGLNGLNVVANDSAVIVGLNIRDNIFDDNTIHGVGFAATEAAFINSSALNGTGFGLFGLIDNSISNNGGSGVRLDIASDATLDLDIINNTIDSNGLDGITTQELVNIIADDRSLNGIWQGNEITNNVGNGINSNAVNLDLQVLSNLINDNGLYGVSIPSAGTSTYVGNQITGNGVNAGARGSSGGVNIFCAGVKNGFLFDNNIFENTGDGLRIVQNGALDFTVFADGNTIEANTDRGVSVLNQGNGAVLDLTLINNKIASNDQEGVLIVNTSSTTQSIDQTVGIIPDLAGTLAADGLNDATTVLNLVVDNNRIISNGGQNQTVSASGLVLLVGTNDGGYAFDEDGGFFGEGNGGVGATITNNEFLGNAGNDLFIGSFVSTVDPATTGGEFTDQNEDPRDPDNDVFNPTGFQGDALARLDLVFANNTFLSSSFNNNQAFFNNDESVFKSRTAAQDTADDDPDGDGFDDGGPFASGTRNRNATRLAARNVEPGEGGLVALAPDLTIGDSDSFLFAGVGQSTFRLLDGSDDRATLQAQGFNLDDPYLDISDAAGFTGPGIDSIPFGWNFFADNVGTLRPQ